MHIQIFYFHYVYSKFSICIFKFNYYLLLIVNNFFFKAEGVKSGYKVYPCVWEKINIAHKTGRQLTNIIEFFLVMKMGSTLDYEPVLNNVWKFPSNRKFALKLGKKVNSTQKQIPLLQDIIKKFSPIYSTVLDLCARVYSTATAYVDISRSCISIEISEDQVIL